MANFKRKRRHSRIGCSICAGQRRRFGAGSWKTKQLIKIINKEDKGI